MRTHLAVTSQETSTKRIEPRDIQVSKRGSEATSEAPSDKLRKKTERFEQEAPNASASSDQYVALKYPASGKTTSAEVRTCAKVRSC